MERKDLGNLDKIGRLADTVDDGEMTDCEAISPGTYTTLAALPDTALIDEAGMARAFGVVARTIRRMVTRGELPPPVRFGGRAVWIAGRVVAWINAAAEKAEAEARQHLSRIQSLGA